MKILTKAVIPAAGLGTRFLPITKSMPKEMMPVVHKPVIHYVVEEAYHSGITDILIITGKEKRAIEDYFDMENGLIPNKYLSELDSMLKKLNIYYVRQKGIRGLGDAIAHAEAFVADDSFAVLLGDTITQPPCLKELIQIYKKLHCTVIAVEKVPPEMISNYGIISTSEDANCESFVIDDLIEKPGVDEAPSDLAILGSYILPPTIFKYLKQTVPDKNGEIQLTDALKLLAKNERIVGHIYSGRRYDIGNKLDWLKSNIELSLVDPEIGKEIRAFLGGHFDD